MTEMRNIDELVELTQKLVELVAQPHTYQTIDLMLGELSKGELAFMEMALTAANQLVFEKRKEVS